MSQLQVYLQGKPIELTQSHYKGAGGEGTIYARDGMAFKIYHEADKCIPEGKIKELATINLSNVLGPREVIKTRAGKPIGFVMPFKDQTQYLCKLFTKGFCEANQVGPTEALNLVKSMQETLDAIHHRSILVVDYNEMNFLTNPAFTEVYYIDVDCYQTPHYPATAIMASIQDPQVKNNQWSEESDWFSFGILACQLYIKTHPYKGRHPDHGKNWQAMMAAGVSIFNPNTKMPPATLDLSAIPRGHRKWLEAVMEHGERSKPPLPDADLTAYTQPKTKLITSTQSVEIKEIIRVDGEIQAVRIIAGTRYIRTKKGLYAEDKLIRKFVPTSGYQARRTKHEICPIDGASATAPPEQQCALLEFNPLQNILTVSDLTGRLEETFSTKGFYVANNRIYVTNENHLVEIAIVNLGAKPIAAKSLVAQIFHQHQIFDGIVIQDVIGICIITIAHEAGRANNLKVPALNGHRILSAKQEKGFAMILSEHQGKFYRSTLTFDKSYSSLEISQEETISQEEINFTVLDRGICIATNSDEIELFANLSQKKVVENSPVEPNQKLKSWQNQVFLLNDDQILKISLK